MRHDRLSKEVSEIEKIKNLIEEEIKGSEYLRNSQHDRFLASYLDGTIDGLKIALERIIDIEKDVIR